MTLLALDGNSILNRAFYGIRTLTTKDGRYTNALVGFLNIYLKLTADVNPDAVTAAFDVKAPTFRHAMYADYKAGRKGMPAELAEQLPLIKEILQLLGIRVLEVPGWEADDILGTLAAAASPDDTCTIATGDRDSLQLVSDRTTVRLAATKGGQPVTTVYSPAEVEAEYLSPPPALIDIKALQGDASDNIPGVPGIGEKTARQLISIYKSLDNLYDNVATAPEIKPAARQKLIDNRDAAYLSKKLGTIRCDAPVDTNYASYVPLPIDKLSLTKLLSSLEMFRLLERLVGKEGVGSVALSSAELSSAELSSAQLSSLPNLPIINDRIDTTSGIIWNPAPPLHLLQTPGIRLYTTDSKSIWAGVLGSETQLNSTQLNATQRNSTQFNPIEFDAGLAAYILNPNAGDYSTGRLLLEYDAADFPELCRKLEERLRENGQLALLREIEIPLARVLAQMEHDGVQVEAERIRAFGVELEERIEQITAQIRPYAGEELNLNSPKQLAVLLYDKLGLSPGRKTKTGARSTDAETLEALAEEHPVVSMILEYRTLTKLKSTYADGLLAVIGTDGRIHSKFNQTDTRTGRLSSSEPNLQNIPIRRSLGAELRRCFVAAEGCILLDADYSQIELRVLAALAEEENMLEAFRQGADIHTDTAARVFGLPRDMVTPILRSRAKAVNFGIIYGIGAYSLAKDIGSTFGEAKRIIDTYFAKYPKIKAYRECLIAKAKETGYAETAFNRRRPLPELHNTNPALRAFGERVATNMPIQGTAADIIKVAMVKTAARLKAEGLSARIVLQVHDELIVEAPIEEADRAAAILREEMEGAAGDAYPLVAEVHRGYDWLSAK
ncbi:MAG: DNA polymerase I [Oscillospiraceae bacterium]|jgi:DNA polymerase-1|nr:DNA polymerase I [Oscillospiraceae bacterium]